VVSAERLILTERTSVEQLGYYAVAYMLTNAVTLFGVSMAQSSIPAFSQVFSPEKREQLLTLYSRVLRISIFSLLPLITILFVIARPFFAVWAGPDFARESTVPFYILLCAMIFNLNSYVPAALVMAAGRSDIFAKLYWIELVPYILAAIVLTGAYGAVGAAAAWSLRTIMDALAFFWLAKRVGGARINSKQMYSQLAASAAVLSPPIILTVMFSEFGDRTNVAALLVSLAIYAVLMWKWILNTEEKRWLITRFRRRKSQLTI
jgi:O-antigen/teichoic acid export membrane protein